MTTPIDTPYCTKADISGVVSEFTIPAGFSDAEIDSIIQEQTQVIDSLCRDHFSPTTRSFILSGNGTPNLSFRAVTQLRSSAITKVQYREVFSQLDTFDTSGTTEDTTSYALSSSRRILVKMASSDFRVDPTTMFNQLEGVPVWVKGVRNYKITGTFGWSFIPKAISRACIWLCRDAMSPGYIMKKVEPKVMEKFADGYSYATIQSVRQAVSKIEQLTGYQSVDSLLLPYRNNTPIMIATTPGE